MSSGRCCVLRATPRRTILALAAAASLGGAALERATAGTVLVTNCNDSGAGSLRAAVAGAAESDVVSMAALSCPLSLLTLTTGEITVPQTNISVVGPGADQLAVSGGNASRIFNHTGAGAFTIANLSVKYGYQTASSAKGGCITSNGHVDLDHARVAKCVAKGTTLARGGGIFATVGLYIQYSAISENKAYTASGTARGGGAYVFGKLLSGASTISGNLAGGFLAFGGGVYVAGGASIQETTISGNTSDLNYGGAFVKGGQYGRLFAQNSTISGNSAASGVVGGVAVKAALVSITASTIAFNTAAYGNSGTAYYLAPGLALRSQDYDVAATLRDTLLANNTYGNSAIESDISASPHPTTTITISGTGNLARVATVSMPAGTIGAACPLLGRLRDNGGPTLTHALLSHSPGIDQAQTFTGEPAADQRGSPRISGPAPDIGAYEVQQDDIVFNAAFDGCPAL